MKTIKQEVTLDPMLCEAAAAIADMRGLKFKDYILALIKRDLKKHIVSASSCLAPFSGNETGLIR